MEYTSQNNLNYYEFMLEYNKIIVNLPTLFLPVCQQYDLFKRTESHWPIYCSICKMYRESAN